jgi:ribosomal 30S subunit maturation factor RimM
VAPRPAPADEARPPSGWVRLGRLGRPFQLQGALHLRSTGPAADAAVLDLAATAATVWLSGVGATRLREARRVGGGVVVAFQGAYTPERARAHVHRDLWADVAATMANEGDDVAVELLEGAAVRVDGEPFGRVAQVVLGAQDLLIVEGPDGPRWVPWGAPYVRWDGTAIDIDDPPPGLLDDEMDDDGTVGHDPTA